MFVEDMGGEPFRIFLPADVRDNGTAEIHRFHSFVHDDFGGVGIEQRAFKIPIGSKRLDQSGDIYAFIFKATFDRLYLLRMDERFVSLDVDDYVERFAHL